MITPTPIPLDNLPEPFRNHVFNFFRMIINAFRSVPIPFTHVTIWDVIIWTIVMACAVKAVKLIYGKGDSTKHE